MTSETVNPPLIELSDVAETALVTLSCRAFESAGEEPILRDPAAEELIATLRPRLAGSGRPLQQALARGDVEDAMRIYVALRSRHFDRLARDFLTRHPDGALVNLGGGLDTRRQRLGISSRLITVDLPAMIDLRRELLAEDGVGADVRDEAWLQQVAEAMSGPVMFLAEGLLMYLGDDEVRRLFQRLQTAFPEAEMVAEVFNRYWLERERRGVIDERLARDLRFGGAARFVSGFEDSDDPLGWLTGARVLNEWSFVDEAEPKLGRLRKLRHFPKFRKRQWVVHYRL